MYKTIVKSHEASVEIKKSNFIARCFFINNEDEAKEHIARITKENYKANHNCYAYRINGAYVLEKASDDGEPAKTAGLPIMECLRGQELENILVIVTRYFGGTKLGTGGLVRAYTEATKAVLDKAKMVEIDDYLELSIRISYTNVGKLEYYLNTEKIIIENTTYSDDVEYALVIRESEVQSFESAIKELLNNKYNMTKGGQLKGYEEASMVFRI